MADESAGSSQSIQNAARRRAMSNIENWGVQSEEVLLLAMQEELGELTQAYLEATHEDGDPDRVLAELIDLLALCRQLDWSHRGVTTEVENGE